MRNDRRRAFALSLALALPACQTTPRTTQPASGGSRFPNASEIEIITEGDSLPRPARIDRGPRYPTSLRSSGVTGQLVAAFVIDTAGRAEPRSISFVGPFAHREFQESVCKFLREEARFVPGRSGDRPRRTLVFMAFAFTLGFAGPTGPAPDVKGYQKRARALPRDELVADLESRPHC